MLISQVRELHLREVKKLGESSKFGRRWHCFQTHVEGLKNTKPYHYTMLFQEKNSVAKLNENSKEQRNRSRIQEQGLSGRVMVGVRAIRKAKGSHEGLSLS